MSRSYVISVCPTCSAGPLVFDMSARAECANGHVVVSGSERRLEVVARLSLCSCGTSDAYRCPLHVNPL